MLQVIELDRCIPESKNKQINKNYETKTNFI